MIAQTARISLGRSYGVALDRTGRAMGVDHRESVHEGAIFAEIFAEMFAEIFAEMFDRRESLYQCHRRFQLITLFR